METALIKSYKKQLKQCVILLLIGAIVSLIFLANSINKHLLANTLQTENEELRNEIELLKKENEALKKYAGFTSQSR